MKSAGVMDDVELAKYYLNDALARFERVAVSDVSKANVRRMVETCISILDAKVAAVAVEAKRRHERADKVARLMCWTDRWMPLPKAWRFRWLSWIC